MQSSLARFLLVRLVTGAAVVIAVVTMTWLVLYLLRPTLIDDGTGLVPQLTGYLDRAFLSFDFGTARLPGDPPVGRLLLQGVRADLALLVGGIVTGTALGVVGGALAATRPRSLVVRLAEASALVAFTAPVYVVGLGLLLLFGDTIAAVPLPVGIPLQYVEWDESPVRWFTALIVPWIVLGLPLAGLCFRVMSGMTVEALGAPHVRTARGKGLTERRTVVRHAAPSGLVPTLTLAGAATNTTLLNLALLEPVFGVPGALRVLPRVVGSPDTNLLLGLVLVVASLVVLMNLVADLAIRALDPTLRSGR